VAVETIQVVDIVFHLSIVQAIFRLCIIARAIVLVFCKSVVGILGSAWSSGFGYLGAAGRG
jgi:uncharacterized membrane protein